MAYTGGFYMQQLVIPKIFVGRRKDTLNNIGKNLGSSGIGEGNSYLALLLLSIGREAYSLKKNLYNKPAQIWQRTQTYEVLPKSL